MKKKYYIESDRTYTIYNKQTIQQYFKQLRCIKEVGKFKVGNNVYIREINFGIYEVCKSVI